MTDNARTKPNGNGELETLPMSGEPAIASEVPFGGTIGRYLVLSVLGRGGMGIVYEAYDPVLDRRIAVKLLREAEGDGVSAGRARMHREAQALARLSHANVITVHDVGEHQGTLYIAMELVAGETLRDWQKSRSWRDILDVYTVAGRGLAAAHAAGLVHRDFKPENVLVGTDGKVRVTDFGLARLVDAEHVDPLHGNARAALAASPVLATPTQLSDKLTQAGTVMGTPTYMAPEQIDGLVVDERSDQFSWCVALWESLYGDQPFINGPLAVRSAAIKTDTPKPPAKSPVPRAVAKVLIRGLAADPAQRWPSMTDALDALAAARGNRRLAATAIGAAVAAAGAMVFVLVHTRAAPPAPPCAAAGEGVAEVWTSSTQQQVRAAFDATGVSYAADTFGAVDRSLGEWRASWSQIATQSCTATRIQGTQSEAMLDLRAACLTRKRDQAAAEISALAHADAKAVERAATYLPPSLEPCNDAGALAGVSPPPKDGRARATIENALAALEREALTRPSVPRVKELLPISGLWVGAAAALGWRPLVARARMAQGEFYYQLGEGKKARRTYLAAAADASAAGDPDLLVSIYQQLVDIDARVTSEFSLAQSWVDMAQGVLARLGPRPLKQLQVWRMRGLVAERAGHPEDALDAYQHALPLAVQAAPISEALVLSDMALVEGELGQLDNGKKHIERSLVLYRAALGPKAPMVGQAEHDLASIVYRLGQYPVAEQHARIGLQIRELAFGAHSEEAAGTIELVGLCELAQDKVADAERDFSRAITDLEAHLGPDNPDVANAKNDIGGAYHRMGRYAEALALNKSVLASREKTLGPDHPDVAESLVNVAIESKALGQWDIVEPNYRRAIAIFEKSFGKDSEAVAITYLNLAEAQRVRGELDAADVTYGIAQDKIAKALGEQHPAIAHIWNGRGQLEAARGNFDAAKPMLEHAVAMREKNGGDATDLAESRFALAKVIAKEDPARAKHLAEQARDVYASSGPGFADRAKAIDAWLKGP
ncbi:MAG TPA: serine/threonine-protein kinase [Kofleriaceae bacterium]|jgi:tetratricopeptide (TPR) repeat protein